jgi:hypothetical protein
MDPARAAKTLSGSSANTLPPRLNVLIIPASKAPPIPIGIAVAIPPAFGPGMTNLARVASTNPITTHTRIPKTHHLPDKGVKVAVTHSSSHELAR